MLLKLATCARDAFDTALLAMVSSPLRKNNNYFMDLAMLDARKRQDHGTRASALGKPTAISKKLDWTPSLHRLLDDWMIPLPVKRATCCWNRSSRVKLTSRQTLNLSLNPEWETRDKMKHGGVRLKRRDLESITNTWQSHTNLHTAPLQGEVDSKWTHPEREMSDKMKHGDKSIPSEPIQNKKRVTKWNTVLGVNRRDP